MVCLANLAGVDHSQGGLGIPGCIGMACKADAIRIAILAGILLAISRPFFGYRWSAWLVLVGIAFYTVLVGADVDGQSDFITVAWVTIACGTPPK